MNIWLPAAVVLALVAPVLADDDEDAGTWIGDFEVVRDSDDFTDADRSFILSYDQLGNDGALGWKCLEDGLNVMLVPGAYVEGDADGDILVRWRIDRAVPSEQEYWVMTPDHDVAFMPLDLVPEFTASALMAERVAVELQDPHDGEVRRYRFGVDGLPEALAELPCAVEPDETPAARPGTGPGKHI